MTELFKYAIPGEPGSLFQDTDFSPDAVLLNLGTNDMGRNDGSLSWADAFIQTYANFLVNLTRIHGSQSLPIFCGVGPMNHSYMPLVQSAIELARSAGVQGAQVVNYSTVQDGCGGHPGRIGHWQMSEIAKPIIAATLGW
ncbi:unnamed protein product [Polarella glacialis]|nr:unnamed protein product [Polarella glacialis]CAE8737435.1 unnamed protein product [Polarella glacialis]